MIKIEIVGEHQRTEPERTVRFEFRKHLSADLNKTVDNLAYLVAEDRSVQSRHDLKFLIKVDGYTKEVEIRKDLFEVLGFSVKVVR